MTLIGVKPKNHPQQLRARRTGSARGKSSRNVRQELATWRKERGVAEPDPEDGDERYTPLSLFMPLHEQHGFVLDICGCPAAPVTRVIGHFWDKAANALTRPWRLPAKTGPWWGNIPFSACALFIEKAWDEDCPGMMLLPANRTEQPFWQRLVEPYRDRSGSPLTTRFVESRQPFGTPEHPDGDTARWHSSPPYGLVLLSWHLAERPRPRLTCDRCERRTELRRVPVGPDTLSLCKECLDV